MSDTLWVKSEFKRPLRRGMVWDAERNRYVKATREDGSPMLERLPQVGFVGNDLKALRATPLRNRAWQVLTREGNVIFDPLTESASVQVNEAQAAARIKRNNALGRIRVGTCPIREVYSGLRASSLIAPLNRADGVKPCDEDDLGFDDEGRPLAPCKHFIAEQKARIAAQAAKNAEQNASQRDETSKNIDALHSMAASTAQLVAHLAPAAAQPAVPAPKGNAGK